MANKHLILGGARSGKSNLAESLAQDIADTQNKQLIYIATAQAGDNEMAERIQRHQNSRRVDWHLIEQSIDLASELNNATKQQCVLIDCLTLWLSNCLHKDCWAEQKEQFINALQDCPADVIMVSNEVGSGIVPMGELSRRFVDECGWLHQELGATCDQVSLVVAGLRMPLKK